MIENNCGATDIVRLFDSPESNVFFTAGNKSVIVDWTKLKTQYVEV